WAWTKLAKKASNTTEENRANIPLLAEDGNNTCVSVMRLTSPAPVSSTDIPDTSSLHRLALQSPVRRTSSEIRSGTYCFRVNGGAQCLWAGRFRPPRHMGMARFAGADRGPSLSCG